MRNYEDMSREQLVTELHAMRQELTEFNGAVAEEVRDNRLTFYKKLFEDSPIGMTIFDVSGQCIEANRAIGEIIGATREEVLNSSGTGLCGLNKYCCSGVMKMVSTKLKEATG